MQNWLPSVPSHWMMWAALAISGIVGLALLGDAASGGLIANFTLPAAWAWAIAALTLIGTVYALYTPRAGGSYTGLLGVAGMIVTLVAGEGSLVVPFAILYALLLVLSGFLTWYGVSQDVAAGAAAAPAGPGVAAAQPQAGTPPNKP